MMHHQGAYLYDLRHKISNKLFLVCIYAFGMGEIVAVFLTVCNVINMCLGRVIVYIMNGLCL